MFSLVNCTSAFSEFKVLPSARRSGYLLMFFPGSQLPPGTGDSGLGKMPALPQV